MRVLFLTGSLSANGRGHLRGREFAAQLRAETDGLLVRHQWDADRRVSVATAAEQGFDLGRDITDDGEIASFKPDVIFFENGVLASPGRWRLPTDRLDGFVADGGVVIVDGMDQACAESLDADDAETIWTYFGARPYPVVSDPAVVGYLRDATSNNGNPAQLVCRPALMVAAEWTKPCFLGIDSLLVSSAVALVASHGSSVLATTEPTCELLHMDRYVGDAWAYPWATVRRRGAGYVVLIAANVSSDVILTGCPDNARWLFALMSHLVDEVNRDRDLYSNEARLVPPAARNRSRPVLVDLLNMEEGPQLEFKSSAFASVGNPLPEKVISQQVVKAVAGLLNAGGGVLLIGVGDDKSVLGIEADLSYKSFGVDEYLQRLTGLLRDGCGPAIAAAYTVIGLEEVETRAVVLIDVEPSPTPVFVKDDKRTEVFYVRSNNTTTPLVGSQAHAYIKAHWG